MWTNDRILFSGLNVVKWKLYIYDQVNFYNFTRKCVHVFDLVYTCARASTVYSLFTHSVRHILFFHFNILLSNLTIFIHHVRFLLFRSHFQNILSRPVISEHISYFRYLFLITCRKWLYSSTIHGVSLLVYLGYGFILNFICSLLLLQYIFSSFSHW